MNAGQNTGTCGHECRCMTGPPPDRVAGIAVRATVPTIAPALRRAFGSRLAGDVVVVEPERFAELRELLSGFSAMERSGLRAAVVRPGGDFDPWAAGPVEQILRRVETPWFSDLMAERRVRFEYQPIVDAVTGRVHGNEALVRSNLEDLTLSPADLIEAARAHDALLSFDQLCRSGAIMQGAAATAEGQRLFVNFIPMTIYDPAVCLRTTFAAAEAVDIPLSSLVFEVVESEQFPHIDHLRAILDAYRAEGTFVALDDVGAGNTAVKYIDELRPDYVKLDREILARAVTSGETAMYEGLVRHCRGLGITVIAEGLETPEELAFCRDIEVDLVQGWLVQRPATVPRSAAAELPASRTGAGTGEGEGGDALRLAA